MSFNFDFTANHLRQMIPTNREHDTWFDALSELLPKYQITTVHRVAGFVSQCAHESVDFTRLEENLNYSWQALRRTWPRHFTTDNIARTYHRQPERIANRAYANRMSNGPESSGDGWKFRGRGIIQLTGTHNYRTFGRAVGMTPDQVIDYVQTKNGAVEAACWYWNMRNINTPADRGDVNVMTRLINGGTHGLADRRRRYNLAIRVLQTAGAGTRPTTNTAPSNTTRLVVSRRGANNETVRMAQQYLSISADGIFGPETERTIRIWQTHNKLPVTGELDARTLREMFG